MHNQQQDNPYKNYVDLISAAVLGLAFFCSIATIFWGADRCLGLGDEGIYLLSARYPDEVQQHVSSVYIYTGYLFRMASFDPAGFRLLGLILVCISVSIFWLGFYTFLFELYPRAKTIKYFRLCSLLFIELGALLHYQWFYMTPNYNTLIGVAISISTGSMLWGFAQTGNWRENKKSIIFAFSFGGLGIGLALFTKFPAGFCMLLLYLSVIVLWRAIEQYQRIILATAVFAGIFVWGAWHFIFVQSPQLWWQMFKEGWRLYQAFGRHLPQSKYITYGKDLTYLVYSAIKVYWPCYLIICTVYPFYLLRGDRRKYNKTTNSLIIFIVLLSAVLLSVKAGVFIGEREPADGSLPFFAVFHFAWILLLLTVWLFNAWHKSDHCTAPTPRNITMNVRIGLGLLVALPIAGSVGTSNPLYNVPLCHAATWFGAILLLLVYVTDSERNNDWLRLFGILSVGIFTASQIIQGYIYDPQLMIKTDLFQQVETTAVGFPARNLKLDMQTHNLVQELSTIAKAHGFQPGGDIIAMHYIPGLVFAMGGRSPGHPAFLAGYKEAEAYSRLALQYADIKRLTNAFVLLNVEARYAESLLQGRGLNFPDGYEKIGTVVCRGKSYSLWKPANLITS
jgi:hypothetical protein